MNVGEKQKQRRSKKKYDNKNKTEIMPLTNKAYRKREEKKHETKMQKVSDRNGKYREKKMQLMLHADSTYQKYTEVMIDM